MKLRLLGIAILVFLLIAAPAAGKQMFGPDVETDTTHYPTIQNYFLSPFQLTDYNFLGSGARARAMGGAFFAVSDDPSAASWNPAGLAQMDKPQMNLSFSSYAGRGERASTLDSDSWNYSFGEDRKYDANDVSFASVVIPFIVKDRGVAFGASYQRLADIFQDNQYALILDTVLLWYGDSTKFDGNYVLPSINEKAEGQLNVINVSTATKLFQSLSFGAGVNVYTGSFSTDVDFFYPVVGQDLVNDKLYPLVDVNGLFGLRFRPHIESKYSGFNFTLGLMYTLEKLRLASVVKTPFNLKEDNDVKLYTDIIQEGQVHPLSYLMSLFFETDREWEMPTMIGFGASYQINSLTLAADVEWRGYSSTELTYRRNVANPVGQEVTTGGYLTDRWWAYDAQGDTFMTPPKLPSLGWRDLTQLRIGAEYVVKTGFGGIPLRVGFRTDPQLYKTESRSSDVYVRTDFTQTSIIGSDTLFEGQARFLESEHGVESGWEDASWVNGRVITLGTGIAWSRIKLDVTYELARYDDASRNTYTSEALFRQNATSAPYIALHKKRYVNQFSQEESNEYSRLMISFTGFF